LASRQHHHEPSGGVRLGFHDLECEHQYDLAHVRDCQSVVSGDRARNRDGHDRSDEKNALCVGHAGAFRFCGCDDSCGRL